MMMLRGALCNQLTKLSLEEAVVPVSIAVESKEVNECEQTFCFKYYHVLLTQLLTVATAWSCSVIPHILEITMRTYTFLDIFKIKIKIIKKKMQTEWN